MFDLLFDFVTFTISIVYPLHQSYKAIQLLSNSNHNSIGIASYQTNKVNKNLTNWLIYWIILNLLITLHNYFDWILRLIPFWKFFKIYLLTWLVFPMLDKRDYKFKEESKSLFASLSADSRDGYDTDGVDNQYKINGAIVIWEFYVIPLLLEFDSKLTEFINLNTSSIKRVSIKLYNLIIDSFFEGKGNLKIFGSGDEVLNNQDDNIMNKSFMESVYFIFKETKILASNNNGEALNVSDENKATELSGKNLKNASETSNFWAKNINEKNMTLLKSLMSILPDFSSMNDSRNDFSGSEDDNNNNSNGTIKRVNSGNEEYDLVDVDDLKASSIDDSTNSSSDKNNKNINNGSTYTSWFSWVASKTYPSATTKPEIKQD
ncbi:hypothetical protein PACTADRAFT_3937 [Pachysolen tannophilus NRRL Y-2460]|uniref:Protein YOP1 n=1 Tax=Pachysolen tannophilus NRRL Y-2460 TaxID=669874 RepID=A0A1E4TTI2_PACTA|nr:hypothetical protein PACTADRAFT_3937 [Pachysolen tannophilus NRRL Y-2460]